MSYLELFNLISKPWSGTKEISLIAHCGRDRATKIRNIIEQQILKEGKALPNGKTILVPTKKVIEFLDLDVDYIINMAKYEANLIKDNNNRSENYYAGISR